MLLRYLGFRVQLKVQLTPRGVPKNKVRCKSYMKPEKELHTETVGRMGFMSHGRCFGVTARDAGVSKSVTSTSVLGGSGGLSKYTFIPRSHSSP